MESCRRAAKERILKDMLGAVQDTTAGGWKVLVLDAFTTRILSSNMRMSDILECNVSVVEDLHKNREPMPQAAVYFIQPNSTNINRLLQDFDKTATYPSVHIFFTNKASTESVNRIKGNPALLKVLKTLKESNLEFLTIDSHTMVTDHPDAITRLLSEPRSQDEARRADRELAEIAERLATLFATLNEFPSIRYKAGQVTVAGEAAGTTARSTLTQRLSTRLTDRLSVMQRAGQLPPRESCDLLILDRSYDPVAPFIHEWTYEAMVYDLLANQMEGDVFRYKTENQAGKAEEKEVVVGEQDEVWVEMRHAFIADVYTALANRFREFNQKNKAAKSLGSKGQGGELSTGNIKNLIAALPQYREILSRLSLHIQMSSDLKTVTNARQLTELGELEQDLVFGDKNSKDLINFLSEKQGLESLDKMRLFICYLATHPGKLDATKKAQWMKVAQLSAQEMNAVCNLAYLGVALTEPPPEAKAKSSFFGTSKKEKVVKGTRKKREDDGSTYALNRFSPLLLDLVEDLAAGRLTAEEYPFIKPSSADAAAEAAAAAAKQQASARQARSGLNWARRAPAAGESAGGPTGRRLVVFIIGGAVRSEMRLAHVLSRSLGRDVILGSTSVETPAVFTQHLYELGMGRTDE